MWVTFECNSTIQLWLTPKRDLSIFFCYIYLLVQGSILLSGTTDMYVALFSNWEYIHWFVIGALLILVLPTLLLFNSNRFMPPFPLFGIDWLGAFMWGLILLCVNFISIYGEHYDYWYAEEIQFALKKNSYKSTFLIGFSSIMMYLLMMYFLVDYQTTKELLVAPIFFRNFGYVIIAIVLITNLIKVPFHHFFQAVSVQAFVSAACGSALGAAVLHHLFNGIVTKNFQLLSANFDRVNPNLALIAPSQLSELLQNQVLMVSFKEIYGYLVIMSIGCFILLLFYKYPYAPIKALYPKMRTIKKCCVKK